MPSDGINKDSGLAPKPFSSILRRLAARAAPDGAPSTTATSRLLSRVAVATRLKPAGADEAGLHAVGAGIAAEQRVIVAHDVAELDRRDVPVDLVFGKFAEQRRARIAMSRAEVICSSAGRPFGLAQLRLRHAEPVRVCSSVGETSIEPPTPSASTIAMSFADFTIIILSALSTVTWVPGGSPSWTAACAAALWRHREQRVQRMRRSLTARSVHRSSSAW